MNRHDRRIDKRKLEDFLVERNALYMNLSLETATAYYVKNIGKIEDLKKFDVPLASAHKARLQWLGATDEMLAESRTWLLSNGYMLEAFGRAPLTPIKRDANRQSIGLPPLAKVN